MFHKLFGSYTFSILSFFFISKIKYRKSLSYWIRSGNGFSRIVLLKMRRQTLRRLPLRVILGRRWNWENEKNPVSEKWLLKSITLCTSFEALRFWPNSIKQMTGFIDCRLSPDYWQKHLGLLSPEWFKSDSKRRERRISLFLSVWFRCTIDVFGEILRPMLTFGCYQVCVERLCLNSKRVNVNAVVHSPLWTIEDDKRVISRSKIFWIP